MSNPTVLFNPNGFFHGPILGEPLEQAVRTYDYSGTIARCALQAATSPPPTLREP